MARKPLSKSIDSRLKAYGMAAAAASVGLLALAEPAQSEVVITVKNIPIPRCDGLDSCPVKVDLNNDGIADFSFTLGSYGYGQNVNAQLFVKPFTGGGVMAPGTGGLAFALVRGAKIGPSAQFGNPSGLFLEKTNYSTLYRSATHQFVGYWGGNHPNRFLGVKFLIHGKTHYGWVRVTVKTSKHAPMSAEITEYGYETVANKSCGAGLAGQNASETDGLNEEQASKNGASLGMLALGADGLPLWRRDDLVQSGKR
jgi:hypothetical protein